MIPDSIFLKCNTADTVSILSKQEKAVILYVNIARCYPNYFRDSIFVPYADSAKKNKKTMYYKSLIKALNDSNSCKPLIFDLNLYPITAEHSRDMGRKGLTGHKSSKGLTFEERTYQFPFCGEDCDYGYNLGLDIVVDLILDEGVPSLGHRENILNPQYGQVAVSIHKHKKYKWNCTIDFIP